VADGVWCVTAGTFPSNSYIVASSVPVAAILIDSGLDGEAIETALDELGLIPSHLLCTHGHFDHLGSAASLQARFDIPVFLHAADEKIMRRNNFLLMAMGLPDRVTLPQLTFVEDGALVAEARGARFRNTPGHTPGSCVIQIDQHWFTGDTVYARGVGLSKLPGERLSELRASIGALWNDLQHYMVHPGHGPSAAGAEVKATNLALHAFLQLDGSQSHAV